MTADEFLGLLTGTPSDEGGGDMDVPPPAVYEAAYAGGIFAPPGQTAEVVLDLGPGEWIAWGEDASVPQQPVVLEVTGELPADLPEPELTATFAMGEYVIAVTEGELTAGPQVVKIENIGTQPHFLYGLKGPDELTEEGLGAFLESEMTGTPAAVGYDPDTDFTEVAYTATQSTGTAIWITVDLEPGAYAFSCFFPDMADGVPHVYHGQYAVVEVDG